MITYRAGAPMVTCDHCYRLNRTFEDGWATRPGFGPAPAVDVPPASGGSGRAVMQAPTFVHVCPECQELEGRHGSDEVNQRD